MNLFVFSHRPEASIFLQEHAYRTAPIMTERFYLADDRALLITGEHPIEIAARVSRALAFLGDNCSQVYHFGFALILEKFFVSNQPIAEIRICYGADGKNLWQKSFSLGTANGTDLISCSQRIRSLEDFIFFRRFAALADRETYAIAMACDEFGLRLRSAKYLIENSDAIESCRQIKNQAEQIAYELFQYAQNFTQSADAREENLSVPDGFYFTHSMRLKYRELLHILQKKYNLNTDEVLARGGMAEIKKQKLTPKEKGLHLLDALQRLLNPELYEIRRKYEESLVPLRNAGWKIDAAQSLEQGVLILSGKIANRHEQISMAQALLEYQDKSNDV